MPNTIPVLTTEAIVYCCRQLVQRVGIADGDPCGTGFEELKTAVFYKHPDQCNSASPAIIITPASRTAWEDLLILPPNSLNWLPTDAVAPSGAALPFNNLIPVLFWGEGCEDGKRPFAEQRPDGSIIFYADIIAATFFMLSRWEETVVDVQDEHGRFPAIAAVASKQNFINIPIVDQYALILRAWLTHLLPRWQPEPRQFSVKLSHDIDVIKPYPTAAQAAKAVGRAVVKQRPFSQRIETIRRMFSQTINPQQYLQNIYYLANISKIYGLDSAFYFMAAQPAPYDNGYDPSSALVKKGIKILQQQGVEIGFHAGYHTVNDYDLLASEKARLDAVLSTPAYGGRQHYLRFKAAQTWRFWEQAGFAYDSTVGYARQEGFRCGTCHPYHPFDIEQNREMDLLEYPLIVMDTTLKIHHHLTPSEGKQRILGMAQQCYQVEGVFTLLWHNTSLDGEWLAWREIYEDVLATLGEMVK